MKETGSRSDSKLAIKLRYEPTLTDSFYLIITFGGLLIVRAGKISHHIHTTLVSHQVLHVHAISPFGPSVTLCARDNKCNCSPLQEEKIATQEDTL